MTLVGMVSFRLSSYTAAPSGPHGQSFAAKGSELAGLIRTVLVGLNTEVVHAELESALEHWHPIPG